MENEKSNQKAIWDIERAKNTAGFNVVDFETLHNHWLYEIWGHWINCWFIIASFFLHESLYMLQIHFLNFQFVQAVCSSIVSIDEREIAALDPHLYIVANSSSTYVFSVE